MSCKSAECQSKHSQCGDAAPKEHNAEAKPAACDQEKCCDKPASTASVHTEKKDDCASVHSQAKSCCSEHKSCCSTK